MPESSFPSTTNTYNSILTKNPRNYTARAKMNSPYTAQVFFPSQSHHHPSKCRWWTAPALIDSLCTVLLAPTGLQATDRQLPVLGLTKNRRPGKNEFFCNFYNALGVPFPRICSRVARPCLHVAHIATCLYDSESRTVIMGLKLHFVSSWANLIHCDKFMDWPWTLLII